MDKTCDIAISYFGDGACEEGVLHESLNLASVMNLPVLYVCENNLFSSHLHIELRQPSNTTARFADSHMIKNKTVDGNDVVGMYKLLIEEITEMRNSSRPFYLEAYTYRWRGHVGHREDIDVGVKRGDDLKSWKLRDPIQRLLNSMIVNEIFTQDEFDQLSNSIQMKINTDWLTAKSAEYPEKDFLLSTVYAS
jgi:pyruvate dehydrogenase E1 component alpha subunit